MDVAQRKAAIRQGFSDLGAGKPETLLGLLDDGVQWTIIGNTKFSGSFNGKADVLERLLGPLGGLLEGHLHITVDNVFGEGDYVAVQGRGESKTTAGGTYNNTYCWVYRWRGDKIVALTEYLDTEVVTASFGR
ncbi:MAG: nuclear transport factor 2 family protein [Gammaproteobacteria bacterium]|nr:nuclear transport factor 2 family protein [Gammaproteobacteria bacterium]